MYERTPIKLIKNKEDGIKEKLADESRNNCNNKNRKRRTNVVSTEKPEERNKNIKGE